MTTSLKAALYQVLATLSGVILASFVPGIAQANETRAIMAGVAQDSAKWLKGRRLTTLAVAEINGPATRKTKSGTGLRLLLIEELQKRGVKVEMRSKVGIRGKYRSRDLPDSRERTWVRLAVEFEFTIEDDSGKLLLRLFRQSTSKEVVLSVLDVTFDSKGEYGKKGDELLMNGYREPKVHLNGNRILAGAGSPYAVEILASEIPIKPLESDGYAIARVERDQEYAVKIINDADHEVAVRLQIDGLSMFAFTELRHKEGEKKGLPLYDMVLIQPHSSLIVPGWHRTNERSDRFKVTEYARSGAAFLPRDASDIGTITATFAASWEKEKPADEPPPARGGYATGFGKPEEKKYEPVRRTVGVTRASVSVRYTAAPGKN